MPDNQTLVWFKIVHSTIPACYLFDTLFLSLFCIGAASNIFHILNSFAMEKNDELQSLISQLNEKEKQELTEFLNEYLEDKKNYSTRNFFLKNPQILD